MNSFVVIICVAIAIDVMAASTLPSTIHASTFTIQQFSDDPNDSFNPYPAYSTKEKCTKDLPIPEIVNVAYSSNGDILNNTIWLRDQFRDPSRFENNANLTIYSIDLTNKTQVDSINNQHLSFKNNITIPYLVHNGSVNKISSRNSTINNFTGLDGSVMLIQDKSHNGYIITFDTTKELFNFYWPKVKRIFDYLSNSTAVINVNDIPYKRDWRLDKELPNHAIASFNPKSPTWLRVNYAMTIQILSPTAYGEPHSDYIVSIDWDWQHKTWIKKIEQISQYKRGPTGGNLEEQKKLLYENPIASPDFSNTLGNGSHVDLSINLHSIGSPDNYAVFTRAFTTFWRQDGFIPSYCTIYDNTGWIPLPPPKVEISLSQSLLNLSPGEQKTLQVYTNSSSSTSSSIFFDNNTDTGLNLSFIPDKLFLSPYGKSSSTLTISAPKDLLSKNVSKEISLPVIGYVDFPIGVIDTATGVVYKSNQTEKITTKAFAYVTLLTEYDHFKEQITESFNLASSSIKELSYVVAAIVAIVTPVGAVLARKPVINQLNVSKQSNVPSGLHIIYYIALLTTAIAGALHIMIAPYLLLLNITFAFFFLLFGILQVFLILPIVKGWEKWKIWYYVGLVGTTIAIILGFVSPVNEKNVSIPIWILIEALQIAYVISTLIKIYKERQNDKSHNKTS